MAIAGLIATTTAAGWISALFATYWASITMLDVLFDIVIDIDPRTCLPILSRNRFKKTIIPPLKTFMPSVLLKRLNTLSNYFYVWYGYVIFRVAPQKYILRLTRKVLGIILIISGSLGLLHENELLSHVYKNIIGYTVVLALMPLLMFALAFDIGLVANEKKEQPAQTNKCKHPALILLSILDVIIVTSVFFVYFIINGD